MNARIHILLLLALAGCSPARTEVLIVIDTDLAVPDELDGVRVDLIGPNGETRSAVGDFAGPDELPRTLGVVDETHTARTVRVTVTGLHRGGNVIQRRAVFQLVPRETRVLRIALLRGCVGVSCTSAETCGDNGCRSIEVGPEELTPYDPGAVGRFDGGADAGAASDGGCVVAEESCNELDDDCDGDIDEDFELESDIENCGACGNACVASPHNGASTCASGACVLRCDPGYEDCNGELSDGCEADLSRPATCGSCGLACGSGTPFCMELDEGSGCVASCEEGSSACDGACVDLTSDPRHCGGCGERCAAPPNAVAACMAGGCSFECDQGYADCDGDAANGCESTLRELAHCGRCGERCERPGAVTSCASGACQTLGCLPLFGDCDGDPANGCEEDLSSNLARCGECSTACVTGVSNATVACVAGSCRLTCSAGFGDCDRMASTGCEAPLSVPTACGMCGVSCSDPDPLCKDLGDSGYGCGAECSTGMQCGSSCVLTDSDPLHCGECGNACPSAPNALASCAAGSCALGCASGWRDCDEDMANGCETSTASDVASCGACGAACPVGPHAIATCTGGTCGLRCDVGFADCNGVAADGCEAALASDAENCGGCGRACIASGSIAAVACVGGACEVASCTAPAADCDGSYANGCEIDTDTNKHNCGACGARCTGPRSCCGGECRPRAECG